MNRKFLTAAILGSAFLAFAAKKNDDPVLMKIAGQDVKLSEFEYLYNKNNTQQQQPVSFEEYVDMFVDYKLKVADAHAEGVDTTRKFVREYNKFRMELADPYLRDNPTQERLVQEAYSRLDHDVRVSHIMLPRDEKEGDNNEALLDSLRKEILAGNTTFEDVARQYSIDKHSAIRGGLMGWVAGDGKFPYPFEKASYDTKVGEISEVINSGVGFHIIRVEEVRPAKGEVRASHILLGTRGLSQEAKAEAKARIDSIYNVAKVPGADFADLAKRFSQDPGSGRKGGDLGWFGAGRMVAEFDSVAFALKEGELSEPFETAYGYHIILKTGHRGDSLPPLEEMRAKIIEKFQGDQRYGEPMDAVIAQVGAETKSSVNSNLKEQVSALIASVNATSCDSALLEAIKASDIVAYTSNGKVFTIGRLIEKRSLDPSMQLDIVPLELNNRALSAYNLAMLEIARENLYNTNAEYRNLANEYRDGILLFEVSNDKVWDRATKDTAGLSAFFETNRAKYTWDKPKFKSYVIFASNDSILQEAQNYTAGISTANINHEAFTADLKQKFGKDIKVERVIAAQGENAITDYLGFGAERPEPSSNQRWTLYYSFAGRIIDAPEEPADVRGAVVSDYQLELEKQWVESLHKTFEVKIYDKVLKKAAKRN